MYCGQKVSSIFPKDYKIINNTFFIEPSQNLVEYYRHFDSEDRKKIIDSILKNNNVIETTF